MGEVKIGTFFASIVVLRDLGVPISSVIDVGAADGSFVVYLLGESILRRGTRFLNIDANPIYEPSLRRVSAALGGAHKIAAASDVAGELALTAGQHPYWTSPRDASDPYWSTVNNLSGERFTVPALTIDQMATEASLPGPYLLKLDIQGHEAAALRGAGRVLTNASVVIVEADMADFAATHRVLDDAGFVLFDLTEVNRRADHTVKAFYPVYVARSLEHLLPRANWEPANNEAMLQAMETRRQALLRYINEKLS